VAKVQYESFREVTMTKNEASDWFSVFKSGVLYVWEGCPVTKHTEDICTTSKSYFLCRFSTASTGKYAAKAGEASGLEERIHADKCLQS
jgi:hypothetical protein